MRLSALERLAAAAHTTRVAQNYSCYLVLNSPMAPEGLRQKAEAFFNAMLDPELVNKDFKMYLEQLQQTIVQGEAPPPNQPSNPAS
jgi:hypothetical protein